jgi:5-(carboxyamino)imidazole ribonucleotide synthase
MQRLGIIGGGQLALYLCEAAQALGAEVSILAEPGDAPALLLADRRFVASLDDIGVVDQFIASCDVVTFDKEAIPDTTLLHLATAEGEGHCVIRPCVETLLTLKDKSVQKEWLVSQDLPTLPFQVLSGNNLSLRDLTEKLGDSIVQKASRGGYDGRGVQILAPLTSSRELWNIPSVVEPFLPDCLEVAVIVARSPSGVMDVFPPVSMEFEAQFNAVSTVVVPAAINAEKSAEATALARRAIDALGGVGVFAVELFLSSTGELLINEISPRVHNSGHVTMAACNVSQFEQHARAVLGLPLAESSQLYPAAMLNILYHEHFRRLCPPGPTVQKEPASGSTLYWYGKTPGHTGRKMGHINTIGRSAGEALKQARAALLRLHEEGKTA